jgi:hypothetical protein
MSLYTFLGQGFKGQKQRGEQPGAATAQHGKVATEGGKR